MKIILAILLCWPLTASAVDVTGGGGAPGISTSDNNTWTGTNAFSAVGGLSATYGVSVGSISALGGGTEDHLMINLGEGTGGSGNGFYRNGGMIIYVKSSDPYVAFSTKGFHLVDSGNETQVNIMGYDDQNTGFKIGDTDGRMAFVSNGAVVGRMDGSGVQCLLKTKAQVDATTPTLLGACVICSDCTVPYDTCISTALTASGYRATIFSAISTVTPGTLVNKGCGAGQ